jgi:hypothetical protein
MILTLIYHRRSFHQPACMLIFDRLHLIRIELAWNAPPFSSGVAYLFRECLLRKRKSVRRNIHAVVEDLGEGC